MDTEIPTGAIPRVEEMREMAARLVCEGQDGIAIRILRWSDQIAAHLAALQAQHAQEIARLTARASRLEDAAFHYQTCNVCRHEGEDGYGD
jgi:hypothetical protein